MCFFEKNPAENDKNEVVTAVLLGLLGAFDLKDHQFLIKKLRENAFGEFSFDLIYKYSSNRIQNNVITDAESDWIVVGRGIKNREYSASILRDSF